MDSSTLITFWISKHREAMSELEQKLFEEILRARQRVYAVGEPTPLQQLNLPGIEAQVFAKREDLGPIKAYKWHGQADA